MVDVPVIDVVQPGARMAAASTKNNKIGVIGTQSTIKVEFMRAIFTK